MTFADPATIRGRMARAEKHRAATLEVAHADANRGIIIRFMLIDSKGELETMLSQIVERAGAMPTNLQAVNDPGWWAAVACMAGLEAGYPTSIMRGQSRCRLHASGIVAKGKMLDPYPEWPRFRIGASNRLLDLRGEEAARIPSDNELKSYAELSGIEASPELLRQMFDVGVIGWGPAGADGRRRIVGVVS